LLELRTFISSNTFLLFKTGGTVSRSHGLRK